MSSNSGDVGEEEEEEEEGYLVKGLLKTMFKQNASRGTKTAKINEEAILSTSAVKKKPLTAALKQKRERARQHVRGWKKENSSCS